ncbi:MAG: molybdopterin-dependent oxidoreductase [Proteobacteria bacterium]|nr:molybdopterin-dependent oxidoreductase [Pseudomonadota bacterium]MBU1640518.1 molybdopterin-dependent oxidoreductase [Pseudomonadota bacterium]
MKCSRRTLLKTGALSGLSLACFPNNASVAKAAYQTHAGKIVEKIPTICGLCKASCPMLALKGKYGYVRLTGNPRSPIHAGTLCARGMAAVQLLDDPDRLKYPLKRVGPRGQGAWKRITWDEAVAEIAGQIKKAHAAFGPESLALLCGSSSTAFIRKFYEGISCPHIYDSSQMHSAAIRELGYGTVFGQVPDPAFLPELERADCLVLMGCHIGENNQVSQLKQVCDFLNRGSELVVVDPRFSAMAAKADHYLAIRPGTDTALILGWIHYILAQGLYDPLLGDQVVGLEELREAVSTYTLDRTAELTNIPVDSIRRAVQTMVDAGPRTVIMPGSHLSWYGADVDRVRAQAILSALLGSWPSRSMQKFDFAAQRKSLSFADIINQIGTKKIKVTAIWGQNPLQSEMAPYKTITALKDAEFVFACDVLPSESTLYADIILPEASFLERMDDLHTWDIGAQTMTGCCFPVVEPGHECRDPYQIVKDIAEGSGQGKLFPAKRIHNYLDDALTKQGSSLDSLKKARGLLLKNKEKRGGELQEPARLEDTGESISFAADIAETGMDFPTPSGKIEFHSAWLAHNGFSPVPVYEPPATAPDGFLRLLYGRCPAHSQTRTAGFTWLNHEVPENVLWLAESLAGQLGITDGEEVRLENRDGFRSLKRIKVKVTPGIREDCCYMTHGFGNRSPFIRDAYLRGVSDSALMSRGKVDVVSGTRGMRDTFVRLLRGGNGS